MSKYLPGQIYCLQGAPVIMLVLSCNITDDKREVRIKRIWIDTEDKSVLFSTFQKLRNVGNQIHFRHILIEDV